MREELFDNGYFSDKAVIVIDTENNVKACNERLKTLLGWDTMPVSAGYDTLFSEQETGFTISDAWMPVTVAHIETGRVLSGVSLNSPGERLLVFHEWSSGSTNPVQSYSSQNENKPFQMLFNLMQEGVAFQRFVIQDGLPVDYVIEEANASFARMLGLSRDEVIGKRGSVIFGTEPAPYLQEFCDIVQNGESGEFIARNVLKKDLHVFASPWGTNCFGTVTLDITQKLRTKTLIDSLNAAAPDMTGAQSTEEAFAAVSRVLRQNGFECILMLLDNSASIKKTYMSFADASEFSGSGAPAMGCAFDKAVNTRLSIYIDHFKSGADSADMNRSGLRGIASPLVSGSELTGIFSILSESLLPGDMPAVTAFANQMAAVLEKLSLIDNLKDHIEQVEKSRSDYLVAVQRLNMAASAGRVGIWDYEVESGRMTWDDSMEKLFGLKPGSFDGSLEAWLRCVHPEDREEALAAQKKALRKGIDYRSEYRIVLPDGEVRYIQARGVLQKDDTSRQTHLLGTDSDVTERKLAETELRKRERLVRRVFELLPVGLWLLDTDGRVTMENPAGRRIWDLDPLDELSDLNISETKDHATGRELMLSEFVKSKTIQKKQIVRNKMLDILSPKDEKKILMMDTAPVFDDTGNIAGAIVINRDITENTLAEQALIAEKELLKTTLRSIGDGVVVTDGDGRVSILNTAFEELSGWTQTEAKGRAFEEVVRLIRDSGDGDAVDMKYPDFVTTVFGQATLIRRDGSRTPVAETAAPIRDASGRVLGTVLVIRDITEEKNKEKKISYLVYHDPLTGLYNRRYFDMVLSELDCQENLPISVISCDVNGLKLTNDAFGHNEGDKLLQRMANSVRKSCRDQDIVVRSGGDEFLVLMPRADENETAQVCRSIRALAECQGTEKVKSSLSVGYETKNWPDEDIGIVIKKAEDYMYRNKSFESPSMRGNSINTMLLTLHEKAPRERLHSNRVSEVSCGIARAMGLPEREVSDIALIGLMHDIGKIAIDEAILSQLGELTDAEWKEMKRHPEIGSRILSASNDMAHIAKNVLTHHERFDGKGYPNGVSNDEIPLLARIVAVADAFDAMTSDRPYRRTMKREEAIAEIVKQAGSQFDPAVVRAFCIMMDGEIVF